MDTKNKTSRRTFVKQVALIGGAAFVAGVSDSFGESYDNAIVDWKKQMGFQTGALQGSRDIKTIEATYEKISAIGYKEIEPWRDYCGLEPKAYRALLDKYGLSMPSTHADAQPGPGLEKQLEGFEIMGIKYVEMGTGGGGARGAAPATGAPRAGGPGGAPNGGGGRGQMPSTAESVKQTAARANENGKIMKKFGQKLLLHNHSAEFQPFEGSTQRPYDIMLAELNPEYTTLQLDIGWATIAGQDVIEMFKKNPGRFELWHVKDAFIKHLTPQMTIAQRAEAAKLVPVGLGDIDYKLIFAQAELAGLKHFLIEQDNVGAWGDEIAAAKVSYDNLIKMLS